MMPGTKVTWITGAGVSGSGKVISCLDNDHVLVAVDAAPNEEHRVIYCAETWLTKVPA